MTKDKGQMTNRKSQIGTDFERQAIAEGFRFIAGVDEVGRGCLAGAVVAAACILDLSKPLPEFLDDSKKLTAKKREQINEELKQTVVAFSIAQVEAEEIDRINILQATKKAMRLAIEKLTPTADFLLIDAVQLKEINLPQKAIIKGDAISASIAAASIIAKTYRHQTTRRVSASPKVFSRSFELSNSKLTFYRNESYPVIKNNKKISSANAKK
jgi:ribonuclease HII